MQTAVELLAESEPTSCRWGVARLDLVKKKWIDWPSPWASAKFAEANEELSNVQLDSIFDRFVGDDALDNAPVLIYLVADDFCAMAFLYLDGQSVRHTASMPDIIRPTRPSAGSVINALNHDVKFMDSLLSAKKEYDKVNPQFAGAMPAPWHMFAYKTGRSIPSCPWQEIIPRKRGASNVGGEEEKQIVRDTYAYYKDAGDPLPEYVIWYAAEYTDRGYEDFPQTLCQIYKNGEWCTTWSAIPPDYKKEMEWKTRIARDIDAKVEICGLEKPMDLAPLPVAAAAASAAAPADETEVRIPETPPAAESQSEPVFVPPPPRPEEDSQATELVRVAHSNT
jgi:hypothetical protein